MLACIRPYASTHLLLVLLILVAALRADERAKPPTTAAPPDSPPIEQLGDEACRAVAQFYEYDRTIPLEARLVEKVKKDDLLREKIVFRGAQGFLVPAFLQLPPDGGSPFPCVLLLHGWSGSKENWWQDGNYISGGNVRKALLAAGFAVLALDAQCHGDRIAQNDFAPVNHYVDKEVTAPQRKGYFSQQEIYIQTTRDYRRAIDYLESRSDIDKSRIGVVGYSMGGTQTFLLTGVEPRLKAAVAIAAPADKSKWSPIAPQNFLPGIGDRPFLTIIGRSDELCPLEHALKLQTMIGSKTKDQVLFDAGHKLPPEYVLHAVDWIKKYL
jgi:dienelactone hydrolase